MKTILIIVMGILLAGCSSMNFENPKTWDKREVKRKVASSKVSLKKPRYSLTSNTYYFSTKLEELDETLHGKCFQSKEGIAKVSEKCETKSNNCYSEMRGNVLVLDFTHILLQWQTLHFQSKKQCLSFVKKFYQKYWFSQIPRKERETLIKERLLEMRRKFPEASYYRKDAFSYYEDNYDFEIEILRHYDYSKNSTFYRWIKLPN